MLLESHQMKHLAWLLAALIVLQPTGALAENTAARVVAVVPAVDGDADDASRELAEELTELLRLMTDHRVVAARTARSVTDYAQADVHTGLEDTKALIASAKEHHFTFQGKRALAEIDEAIASLDGRALGAAVGAVALDAFLSKALIAKAVGREDVAREALMRALRIDPLLELSPADYPPSLVKLLASVRSQQAMTETGSVSVTSRPAGAEISLNGINRGVAPLVLEGLPAGTYALTVAANRYAHDEREITVLPGKEIRVKVKLSWKDERAMKSSSGGALGDIQQGLALAAALKVDRLVSVDADAAPAGAIHIRARTVDANAHAGFVPLEISRMGLGEHRDRVAELANRLVDQLNVDVFADPAKMLDPVGEGDAVVLGKRKKPLTRQPLFWGAIGIVVAGAIAGGIAAAMSGGSDTGSLKVSFR
jgi:hypothetical protein